MKRWNGWGDEHTTYPLPDKATAFLEERVGSGTPPQDAAFKDVVAQVPASRLPHHPLVNTDADVRLAHARGQSLPDWIALRSGRIPAFPDGVAFPTIDVEVASLIRYAKDAGVANPERHQWRVDLVPVHEVLAWILVPLALLGLARSVGRDSPGMQVVGMQLFTLVFAAAFYFGETRYRVPYDAVLVVAAACAFTPPPAPASPPDRRLVGVVAVALLLVLGFIV